MSRSFKRAIEEHAAGGSQPSDLVPVYRADAVLRGEDVNSDTALALASLGPFGSGNPRPRLLVVDAEISQPEATRNGGHLRCVVEVEGVRAEGSGSGWGTAFNPSSRRGRRRALGVQLRINEWQGSLRPEFLLENAGEPAPREDAARDLVPSALTANPPRSSR